MAYEAKQKSKKQGNILLMDNMHFWQLPLNTISGPSKPQKAADA